MVLRNGLIAAVFTPFDAQGEVDLKVIEPYVEHAMRTGVAGVFVCGSTGEGPSLSTEERMAVTLRWLEVAPSGLPVIVHVGHASLPEAKALAAHAQQHGAMAVASVSPSYFRPGSAELIAQWCAQVAAAASDIGFFYYHIPALTGVAVPPDDVLARLIDLAPNVAGVKFTSEDLAMLERCRAVVGSTRTTLFGRDEMAMAALAMGIRGGVGSTFNYLAEGFMLMIRQIDEGRVDLAAQTQAILNQAIGVVRKVGNLPVAKALMAHLGVSCGDARLPFMPANGEAVTQALAAREQAYKQLRLM